MIHILIGSKCIFIVNKVYAMKITSEFPLNPRWNWAGRNPDGIFIYAKTSRSNSFCTVFLFIRHNFLLKTFEFVSHASIFGLVNYWATLKSSVNFFPITSITCNKKFCLSKYHLTKTVFHFVIRVRRNCDLLFLRIIGFSFLYRMTMESPDNYF